MSLSFLVSRWSVEPWCMPNLCLYTTPQPVLQRAECASGMCIKKCTRKVVYLRLGGFPPSSYRNNIKVL
jgi:hypothetical protein